MDHDRSRSHRHHLYFPGIETRVDEPPQKAGEVLLVTDHGDACPDDSLRLPRSARIGLRVINTLA